MAPPVNGIDFTSSESTEQIFEIVDIYLRGRDFESSQEYLIDNEIEYQNEKDSRRFWLMIWFDNERNALVVAGTHLLD